MKKWIGVLGLLLAVGACKQENQPSSVIFGQAAVQDEADYDLADIQASGELIAATLSGPDTYYEYRGEGFGVEFEMARSFASHIGTRLRIEVVLDSTALMQKLATGEADLALTTDQWRTRANSPQLTAALQAWWKPELREQTRLRDNRRQSVARRTRLRPRAPMLSREHSIISTYDDLFRRHASTARMDWRLLAAQCYQESAFDPKAVSWAGAQGLMQIMPATASHLGVSPASIFDPAQNIAAAARYLAELQATFADIREGTERLCFVLAAYNGGASHVRDAMALAERYGGDPHRWNDVNRYIILLSNPQYYRDPVVRAGYLRGNETSTYVAQILARWAQYRGSARASSAMPAPAVSRGGGNSRNPHVRSREEFLNDSLR